MDNAGKGSTLVLFSETPVADLLQALVGHAGCNLFHVVQTEIASIGNDRGEQDTHLPGDRRLFSRLMEMRTKSDIVLNLYEQVCQPDRTTACIQPTM